MDGVVHEENFAKRQGLGGFLSGIFGGGGNGQSASTSSNTDPLGLGGLTSGLLPTQSSPLSLSLPGLTHSSTSTTSTSATSRSAISLTSSSTTSSSTSSSSSTTSSSSPSTTPPPTSSTSASESSTSVVTSTSDGNPVVYTTIIAVPASATTSESSTGAAVAPKSFFQNKPLEGGVFAIVGVIGLVIVVAIATFAIRRKAKDRLHEEALTWPDEGTGAASRDVEKGGGGLGYAGSLKGRRMSDSSTAHGVGNDGSSSGHGTVPMPPGIGGYMPGGYGAAPVLPPAGYPQQQMGYDYNAGQGYGRNLVSPPTVNPQYQNAYGAPVLPNPIYDPVRSPVYPANPTMPQFNVTSPPPMGATAVPKALPPLETERANLPYADRSSPTAANRRSASLLSPVSASEHDPYDGVASDGSAKVRKRASSHSRELDPAMPAMPATPALPDSFGDDNLGAVGSVQEYDDKRVLKVANQY